MKRRLFSCVAVLMELLLLPYCLQAQDVDNSLRVGVSYHNMHLQSLEEENFYLLDAPEVQFTVEYNRRITPLISLSAYLGLAGHEQSAVGADTTGCTVLSHLSASILYGIGAKLHVLPLFGDFAIAKRIDPYVSFSVGGYTSPMVRGTRTSIEHLKDDPYNTYRDVFAFPYGTRIDFRAMVGLNLYIQKNFGLFGEYGYRYGYYHKGHHFNVGLFFVF